MLEQNLAEARTGAEARDVRREPRAATGVMACGGGSGHTQHERTVESYLLPRDVYAYAHAVFYSGRRGSAGKSVCHSLSARGRGPGARAGVRRLLIIL